MPWCPKCFDEYVSSMTTCNECGITLVKEKPILKKSDNIDETNTHIFFNDKPLPNEVLLIEAEDEIEYGFYCNTLDEHQIPYRTSLQNGDAYNAIYMGGNTKSKNIYIEKQNYDLACDAFKQSVNHLPIDVPIEDQITDEDIETQNNEIFYFVNKNAKFFFIGGFIIIVLIFLINLL